MQMNEVKKLELVKEINFEKPRSFVTYSLIGAIMLIITLLLLIQYQAKYSIADCLIALILSFPTRYPHEYIHKLTLKKVFGINSTINYKRINAVCIPDTPLTSMQLIINALAPLLLLSLAFILLSFLHKVFLLIAIVHLFTCISDTSYVLQAVKNKNSIFVDEGLSLKIYKAKKD